MMNCNCENMLYQFGNNIRSQRQGEVGVGGDGYSSHDSLANNNNDDDDNHNCRQQHQINPSCSKTTSNFSMSEVAELTWENGQLAMHGLSGLLPSTSTKPTAWMGPNDTLESIIHYATYPQQILMTPIDAGIDHEQPKTRENMTSVVASSGGAWSETSGKKRTRADSDQCGGKFGGGTVEERGDRSACGSASVTFCRDNDTTMMTWASYESPMSLKAKNTDEDSACHGGSENQDENLETKTETNRSHSSSRRTRATAIHNQSERRRRDRINQKMKALQKLVPNANKTDKASMLDEVIEYLKQLQAQVHMMNNVMNISPNMNMMMPLSLGMHHHHHHHQQQQQLQQLSMLARMHGMSLVTGMATAAGMGMLSDINTTTAMSIARGSSNDGPNPLIHPSMVAAAAAAATSPVNPSSGHFMGPSTPPTNNNPADVSAPSGPSPADPYYAFLTQSMNLDLYNKLATIYRQPISQTPPATSGPSTATSSHG